MRNIFVRFSGLKRYNSTVVSVGIVAATTILAAQAKAEIVKFKINDESPLLTTVDETTVEVSPVVTSPTPEPTQELKIETNDNATNSNSHTTIDTTTSTGADGQPKSDTKITTDPQNKVTTNPETNETVIDGGSYTIKMKGNNNDPIAKKDDDQNFRSHSSSNESHSLRINSSTRTRSTSTNN